MVKGDKTEDLRRRVASSKPIDALDRKILTALARDAEQSYAALGEKIGLSGPATHERVKRLRASGRIKRKVALIDGAAVGKPLLAFVLVDTEGWRKEAVLRSLRDLPEVEEIHSVAGDACLLLKIRCADPPMMEQILLRLYAVPGVKSTRSYMALSTLLERPVQGEVTTGLIAPHE